jgi:two-component system CitB family response regulator
VLLDLYLPDASGLHVLRRLKARAVPPDVIVLTGPSDTASVHAALRGGALHYLIEPCGHEVLRQRLASYRELHARRAAEGEVDQRQVDRLFGLLRGGGNTAVALPTGQSPATAELVLQALADAPGVLSASDVPTAWESAGPPPSATSSPSRMPERSA